MTGGLGFTERERQVADELARDGAGNRQIAARLGIAEDTVKSHVKAILRKAGCDNRAAVVVKLRADVLRAEILAPIRALLDGAAHRADCRFAIAGEGLRVLIDADELRRALEEAEAA